MSVKAYAIIVGAGPGAGRAIAIRFSQRYPVVLISRSSQSYEPIVKEINIAGGKAIGLSADACNINSLSTACQAIKEQLPGHVLGAAVFNASAGVIMKPFAEVSPQDLEASLDGNVRGFFNFAQTTLPLLEEAADICDYPPTLIVTGATASVKGSAEFATFAAGKSAKRAMTQSIAREYNPKGIHIAHAVIDGAIDNPNLVHYSANGGVKDGKIAPESIAESYWNLHTQHRSGFTWEVDIRPFIEKW